MLKTIVVYPDDIIPSTPYMVDNLGRLDLLGQILFIGYGIKIQDRMRSPAEQEVLLRPFTVAIRQEINNTELCLTILKNASLTASKQIKLANDLLEEYDITLEVG